MESLFLTLVSDLRRLTSRFQGFIVPRNLNGKKYQLACLDEVTIPREGDSARIEPREDGMATEYKHVAFEVPLGSAQIEYFARGDQWVPRGGVLRCLIRDDEHGQLVIHIDQQELRLKQFGKLLTTYAGWGMRVEFVPEDEVHRRPAHEVREPKPEE
jgi:hypothetical protein